MLKTIGNTPMIKIKYQYKNKEKVIYSKLEYYNITGSIKDRVAYYMIMKAKERGELKEGMPIIEATSGNTGISISALGAYFHHPVHIFMPDWVSEERVKLMKSYNANVILISREQGGFATCIKEAQKLAKEIGGFLPDQFSNPDNVLAHYETTGEEIVHTLPEKVGAFISGIGTGGTLMGTARRLKKENEEIEIVALEPDKMPILSKNKIIAQHKIEGIGDDFIPKIVNRNLIDRIVLVNDDDAIHMAQKIANELGIGVGISSGANLLGCIIAQETIEKPVVTVFADDNKKYLSTDLAKEIKDKEEFISSKVKLLGYEII